MKRYERQTSLDEIGSNGQKLLKQSSVLVVGAGGLGSPVGLYLAGAGVGHIGIMDHDTVSLNNLQRQVLYEESDLFRPKAEVAAQRLGNRNSDISVRPIPYAINYENAAHIIKQYDIVVDCCDNYPTRCLLDSTCQMLGRPFVYGAVQGFEGQVSVFDPQHSSVRYPQLYPEPPDPAPVAVAGPAVAVVGAVEAHETLKLICGYGNLLVNKLWTINLKTMQSYIIEL